MSLYYRIWVMPENIAFHETKNLIKRELHYKLYFKFPNILEFSFEDETIDGVKKEIYGR